VEVLALLLRLVVVGLFGFTESLTAPFAVESILLGTGTSRRRVPVTRRRALLCLLMAPGMLRALALLAKCQGNPLRVRRRFTT
jgi:hypothetical protein